MSTGGRQIRADIWLTCLLALTGAAAGTRAEVRSLHGLTAEYFADDDRQTPRIHRDRTLEISTGRVAADIPFTAFRARWFGYLTVTRAGEYTFAISAGGTSTLQIDGRPIVDYDGGQPAAVRTGQVQLDPGSHFVLIEYTHNGGPREIGWSWARGDGRLTAVTWRVLSPTRASVWRPPLLLALDWTIVLLIAATIVVGTGVAVRRARTNQWRIVRHYPRAASFVLFVALAILHTWPLASDPSHLSRNDNSDTLLNEWVLAWFAHQAPRAPLRLFEANIFYPEPHTLAYSEAMIVQAVMAAPLRWVGASPVLTYNLVLLAGFVLTAWAMCLVLVRWTDDWAAGVAAGMLFGFNAHTLARIPHLQAQHVEFLPLALAALDQLLRTPNVRQAARLAGWFALQALASVYLLVFSTVALAAAALTRAEWSLSRERLKVVRHLALAGLFAALVLFPYLLPYWQLSRDSWFSRSLEQAAQYSGSWGDYLATPGKVHFALWSHRWWEGDGLFPGFVGLLLAGIAIVRRVAFTDSRARMCLAVGACGMYLSFGPAAPGYAVVYKLLPMLSAIRAPVRFGYLAILAVAVLAGFGLVEVRRRLPVRARALVLGAVFVLITLESLAAPLYLTRFGGIPRIYRWLRSEPNAVVAELPLPTSRFVFVNAQYMLYSTEHWKPMVNGYSGFVPRSYYTHLAALAGFPNQPSLDVLHSLGVTHVFVHREQLSSAANEELARTPNVQLMASEGPIALFRLTFDPRATMHADRLQ